MTEPLQNFGDSHYQRPNQTWICGNDDFDGGCPRGPDGRGQCVTRALCEPTMQHGTWACNRSRLQGGKCDVGPTGEGACGCQVVPCRPRRSLRSQRGRMVFFTLAVLTALLAIMLASGSRNEFLAPGPLTEPHALILKDQQSARCASCHDAGRRGLGGWLLATVSGPASTAKPQWQLCLECHKNLIDSEASGGREAAIAAHTLDRRTLMAISEETAQHIEANSATGHHERKLTGSGKDIACSACHQEHHGALHDLTVMSDQQCNVCHQNQFASFAEGHPEFRDWPYRRRTRIIFDHVSHGERHFPESKQAFACVDCHAIDENQEPQLIGGYEQNCAGCHDADLQRSMAEPLPLIRLPMIDRELLAKEGLNIGAWPEDLQGDFDGAVPPLMLLMLWADPVAKASLSQFDPGFDFFNVQRENYDELDAASELVWAIKRLLFELQSDGEQAILRRAKRLCDQSGQPWDADQFAVLAAGFDMAAVRSMSAQFGDLARELATAGQTGTKPKAAVGRQHTIPVGFSSWSCTDDRSELVISVRGHDNPILRGWLELTCQLGASAKEHAHELLKPTGVGQCTMCHSLEYENKKLTRLRINWRAGQAGVAASAGEADMPRRSFTKFEHGPHLLQHTLADCDSCHRADQAAAYAEGYQVLDPNIGCTGFAPISKSECAGCHVQEGAGDGCLKCHNYHVVHGE